jgi:hypothetical protein
MQRSNSIKLTLLLVILLYPLLARGTIEADIKKSANIEQPAYLDLCTKSFWRNRALTDCNVYLFNTVNCFPWHTANCTDKIVLRERPFCIYYKCSVKLIYQL